MKEKLYTIELHDALLSGDECPFCYLERDLEQKAIEFGLGSSYMESDTRDQTDLHRRRQTGRASAVTIRR